MSALSLFTRHRGLAIAALAVLAVAAGMAVNAVRGTAVQVAPVLGGAIQHSIVVSGRVQAPNRVQIGSVITGRVEQVLVVEGDKVEAGQPLILLETSELKATLAQTRAAEASARARLAAVRELSLPQAKEAVDQAEAQLQFAEAEFKRNRELRDKGFISEARLQDLERLLTVARSQRDAARAQAKAQGSEGAQALEAASRLQEAIAAREVAESKLTQTTIRDSVAGTVLMRSVEPGDIVSPGKTLLVVNSSSETRLSAQIDEKNLPFLQVGVVAVASSEAFPAERFKAELYYVSPMIDITRGSVEARFRVPEPPAYLRADMTVSIDIGVARKAQALTVPSAAVRDTGGEAIVQVLRGGSVEPVKVTIGIRAGDRTEILSGLTAGETVVLTRDVPDGTRAHAGR
jgi:HlyD family secretion protein